MTQEDYLLLAGLYKNLGKLGEHEESLEKAILLLQKGNAPLQIEVRWILQLTAMKSTLKKYTLP